MSSVQHFSPHMQCCCGAYNQEVPHTVILLTLIMVSSITMWLSRCSIAAYKTVSIIKTC